MGVTSILTPMSVTNKPSLIPETSIFYDSPASTPSYLSDSRSRSVTPIISPQFPTKTLQPTIPQTSDSEPPPPIIKKPGRPPKYPGISKASDARGGVQNDPELSKLAEQQRIVGPLMEKMGCVLASEERRMTFLDDEDFEDEVVGSEYDVNE